MTGFKITGTLQYYSVDQEVAWKIYVELITRISGNRLPDGHGILRESLTSLYKAFGALRTLLKDSGAQMARKPEKGVTYTVAGLLLEVMNKHLRPFLSEWHPRLEAHEKNKKEDESQFEHEKKWGLNSEFRDKLNILQDGIEEYIQNLKAIAEGETK